MSVGLRQEIQTQVDSKWNLAPRAAFTWNATKKTTVRGGYGIFYDWYDSALYEQTIRVDGNHQVDADRPEPGFPVIEGGGNRLPASMIRSASLEQPRDPTGVGRPRAAAHGVGRLPHRLHVDARQQHARSVNVNAPTQRCPARSGGGQRHRDPVERQARVGSRYRGLQRALHPTPHSRHGDVSVRERAQLRRLARRPCRRTASIRMRTGVRRRRTCGTASSSTSTPRSQRRAHGLERAGVVAAAVQHHHRSRCQRRHALQRSPARASSATPRAARRSGPPTCASTSRSALAAPALVRRTCRCPHRPRLRAAAR